MLNFCDFIQVFVFTRNHHLKIILVCISLCAKCLSWLFLYSVQFLKAKRDFSRLILVFKVHGYTCMFFCRFYKGK